MPTSPSPKQLQGFAPLNHQRIVRAAILNGLPIPAWSAAVLEAAGINVGELEQRLRQNMEFTR